MSHYKNTGSLESYNSLLDKNLSGYFANTHMRKHLVRSGLITKNGHITNENAYRLKVAKKEHKKHVRELLATAIVEKALDMERMRQYEIRKRLNELYKIELVQKVRSERSHKSNEELIALLSPRSGQKSGKTRKAKSALVRNAEKEETRLPDIHFDEKTRRLYYENNDSDNSSKRLELTKSSSKAANPHTPHPPTGKKKRKRKVHRGLLLAKSNQLIAHRVQLQSMAEVTMKFLGSPLNLTNDMFPSSKLNEIQVVQQHCGASTVCVFRELLPSNTVFTFVSRRHRGSPFGLTINIDGIKNIRVSSCCEYKHKPGNKIGGKNSQFALISVHGAAPCYRCQVRLNLLDGEKDIQLNDHIASSDDEAAAESYDIIVSRGGKREHTVRPASAHAATQTDDETNKEDVQKVEDVRVKAKESDLYQDDDFEEEDEKEFALKVDPVYSSDSSASESESESDDEADEKKMVDSKEDEEASSSSSVSGDEDEDETKKGVESHKESLDDADKDAEGNDRNDYKDEDSVYSNLDDSEEKEEGDEEEGGDSSTEKEKSDVEGTSEPNDISGPQTSHVYLEDEVKLDSDEESSKSSISSTGSDHSDSENDNEKDLEDDGVKVDGDQSHHEGGSSANDDVEKNDVGYDMNTENSSDEQLSVKEKESTPSIISRESTMLTGNEDGKYDDENKTIQFNEEVDVVTYEKVDVDHTPEITPRSDDEQDENETDTIQNGGERVVLANFDVDDDDVDEERENDENDVDKTEGDEIDEKENDVEGEEDSDDHMLDKGHNPEEHGDVNELYSKNRETPPDSVQSLVDSWRDVDLANFAFSPEQTDELLISLDDNSDKVESISLRNTLVGGGIRKLKEVLKKAVHLKMLNLNETNIDTDDAVYVAEILADGQHQIKVLMLHGNPLGDEGITAIMESLRHNTTLTNLVISDCNIGDIGIKAVCTFLRENSSLTDLSLGSNQFSNSAWKDLADTLKINNTLSTLSVDHTNLLDERVKILCEGISANTSLVSLDIENNSLDDAAGEVLYKALVDCETLIDVTLMPNNKFSEEMEQKLRSFIHQRIEQKNT